MFLSGTELNFGDTLSIVLKSLYLLDSMNLENYPWFSVITIITLSLLLLAGLVYLLVRTLLMKRDFTAMGAVLGEEGEVTEILDDFGKRGWLLIYGENWKFKSEKALKVGDTVKVIKHKKMDLIVQKVSD